jgi:membrane-associated phospholipid phosphatase
MPSVRARLRLAGAFFAAFVLLLVLVNLRLLQAADTWLTDVIQAPRNCGLMTFSDFADLPFSAEGSAVLIVLATVTLLRRGYRALSLVPWLVVLPTLLELAAKVWVDQPEPPIPVWAIVANCAPSLSTLDVPTANSFPSGHAIRMAYLGLLLLALVPDGRRRMLTGLGLGMVVAVLAWARVYPGFHWPTDVLGGVLLGTAVALPVVHLLRKTA